MLSALPAVGEPDVMRAVQLLPGVVARHDFTAGLNARGGEQDQNLVLLDGMPLDQPFHLGGVFGTFMDATVGDLRLQAGAFPASYGGRLSSVLEVTSAEEARPGAHGEMQLSALAASLAVGGATPDGRSRWPLAARRTYADRIARAVADRDLPYWFHDAQLHASRRLGGGGTLSLTAYHGRDRLREDFAQRRDTLGVDGLYDLQWGNDAVGVTWAQPVGERSSLLHRASVSRFVSDQDEVGGALLAANDVREWRATGAWRRGGVRLEHLSSAGWTGLSPRLSARWFTSETMAATVAAGSTAQWVHALREEDDALRLFARRVLSDSGIPVARASQASVGLERWLTRSRFVRIDAFGKRYGTLIERNPTDDRGVIGDEFRQITGTSRGVDVFLRQVETGPRSAWLAYTYTWNERRDGVTAWLPAQDRRHTLNTVGTWRLGNGTVLGGRVGVGSGVPCTGIEAQLVRRVADPRGNQWDRNVVERDLQGVPAARNAERLPPFVRLDLSAQRGGVPLPQPRGGRRRARSGAVTRGATG